MASDRQTDRHETKRVSSTVLEGMSADVVALFSLEFAYRVTGGSLSIGRCGFRRYEQHRGYNGRREMALVALRCTAVCGSECGFVTFLRNVM